MQPRPRSAKQEVDAVQAQGPLEAPRVAASASRRAEQRMAETP
jgi:hypothetical protein